MQFNICLLLGALSTLVTAQQHSNTSKPFNLIIRSTNATLDGCLLSALHEGAAIESLGPYDYEKLSVGNTSLPSYLFNYSAETGGNDIDQEGNLFWPLKLGGGGGELSQVLEGLTFPLNPTSNVIVPLFYPSQTGLISLSFDDCGKMYISGFIDDTIAPFQYPTKSTKYYRWYICTTYAGYLYETLAWTLGNGPPENPTCQKVDVQRLFDGEARH